MNSLLKIFGVESIRHLVIKTISSLGIGVMSYQGLNILLGMITDQVMQNFNSLPVSVLSIMGLGGLDHFINIVLSAYSARFAMASIKKFRMMGAAT